MNIVIKLSIFKEPLSFYLQRKQPFLLNSLEWIQKQESCSYTNMLDSLTFVVFYIDVLDNLTKMQPLLNLSDILILDLTLEQRAILQNFSFFLIRFWSQGLKMFATTVHMDPVSVKCLIYDWSNLFHMWLKIPIWLNELKPFLNIHAYNDISTIDVCAEFYKYFANDDSIIYMYAIYHLFFFQSKPSPNWEQESENFHAYIYSYWNHIDSNFLFYLLSILKESNKYFIFNVKKIYNRHTNQRACIFLENTFKDQHGEKIDT